VGVPHAPTVSSVDDGDGNDDEEADAGEEMEDDE
jgi:hypothetical protein